MVMKMTLSVAAIVALSLPGSAFGQTLRIAVSPFVDRSGQQQTQQANARSDSAGGVGSGVISDSKADLGGQVADALITELIKQKRYDIVERVQLEKVIAEKKLSLADLNDTAKASEAARIIGANLILTGSITEAATSTSGTGIVVFRKNQMMGRVVLDARLVDIATTRAIWATTTEGTELIESREFMSIGGSRTAGVGMLLGKAARKAANLLVTELVPILSQSSFSPTTPVHLPLEADATLRNGKLYLGVGAKGGVSVNDNFEIIALSDPIKIGERSIREELIVGTARIEQVMGDYSVAVQTSGTIGPKQEVSKVRRVDSMAAQGRGEVAPPPPVIPAIEPARNEKVEQVVYVKGATANLRSGPSATATLVGRLTAGAKLHLLAIDSGWLNVRDESGVTGWILATLTASKPSQ